MSGCTSGVVVAKKRPPSLVLVGEALRVPIERKEVFGKKCPRSRVRARKGTVGSGAQNHRSREGVLDGVKRRVDHGGGVSSNRRWWFPLHVEQQKRRGDIPSPPLYFICDNGFFFFGKKRKRKANVPRTFTRLRGLYLVASKINRNNEEGTFLVVAVYYTCGVVSNGEIIPLRLTFRAREGWRGPLRGLTFERTTGAVRQWPSLSKYACR